MIDLDAVEEMFSRSSDDTISDYSYTLDLMIEELRDTRAKLKYVETQYLEARSNVREVDAKLVIAVEALEFYGNGKAISHPNPPFSTTKEIDGRYIMDVVFFSATGPAREALSKIRSE